MEKIIDKIFVVVFFSILVIPLLFFNKESEGVLVSENRNLTEFPKLENILDGNEFMIQLEEWFNDRIGMRQQLISSKAFLDFKLFGKINTNDMYIGKNGSLIYATKEIIKSYQQKDSPTNEELNELANSFLVLQNYVESLGIQFYYVPCYDKQLIYPNEFMSFINQYGDKARTEIVVEKLLEDSNLHVVDFKKQLLDGKENYLVYGDWSDPTHWTSRGAYIGYLEIMKAIKENNQQDIKVLEEKDYDLSLTEYGQNLNGFYYYTDTLEQFRIKHARAEVVSKEILGSLQEDNRSLVYENKYVTNNLKLLIIGDSYIETFLLDDFAESFYSTAIVWHEHLNLENLNEVINTFEPNIILLENAQRVNIENQIINIAKEIKLSSV